MPYRWAPIAGALLLLVASVLLAACGGYGDESEEGGTKTVAGLEANDHGTKDVSGMSEVKLELDDDYFEPTILKGDPGQRVKVELDNEGEREHNLTIGELNIDQDVEPGQDAEVELTFPMSGTLSFFCKYHKAQGMAGALEAAS